MSNQHNKWLDWKLRHGLASRGRAGPLNPKGLAARALYALYFKKFDVRPEEETPSGPRVFKQNVGGTVGPVGTVNHGE